MSTGPEHYQRAEALLETALNQGLGQSPGTLAAAQVYATLALAAATALNSPGGEDAGMSLRDLDEWERACSAVDRS